MSANLHQSSFANNNEKLTVVIGVISSSVLQYLELAKANRRKYFFAKHRGFSQETIACINYQVDIRQACILCGKDQARGIKLSVH